MLEERPITLYLAPWQKRMVRDYLKIDAKNGRPNKITFSKIDRLQWVTYRIPDPQAINEGHWNFYLTDEQIAHLAEVLDVKIEVSALNVSPELLKSKAIVFG